MNPSLRNSLFGLVLVGAFGLLDARCASPPGLVVAWGNNTYGQTVVPAGLSNVVGIAAGDLHSLALIGDGSVVAWGTNKYHQLDVPAALTNVSAVACGSSFSLALKNDGTVAAWGQIFNGSLYSAIEVPNGLVNVKEVAGGGFHCLALKTNGNVVAWGYNGSGQASVPPSATNVIAIAAGATHSLALRADHSLVTWGQVYNGSNYIAATLPAGLSNIIAIAAGGYHSLALRADSTVTAWGYDASGETNVPAGLTNVQAIAAGGFHNLVLESNAVLAAWGADGSGQTQIPAELSDVSAIAGGLWHSMAISLAPLIVSPPPTNITLTSGAATNIAAGFASGSPLVYQWSFDGAMIPGATASALPLANFDLSIAGVYCVLASNQFATASAASVVRLANSPIILVDGIDAGGGSVSRTNSSFITMSSSFGATSNVFYTLDGSVPDFGSIPYLGGFTLTSNAIIRAIAYDSTFASSAASAPIQVTVWSAYSVVASTPGGGTVTLSPEPNAADGLYLSNTLVNLTPTPAPGWSFLGWTGDSLGATGVLSLSVTGPLYRQAIFGAGITLSTNGGGVVTIEPSGTLFPYGSQVELTAVPAPGNYFSGWALGVGGFANPLTISVTNLAPIEAVFLPLASNDVSLAVSTSGDGVVVVSPSQDIYTNGQTVTLTAEPGTNSVFRSWTGPVSGATNPLSFVLTTNIALTAVFGPAPTNPPLSAVPVLAVFDSTNGSNPNGLVVAADGSIFGTTQNGGTNGDSGTVFRLSPDGALNTIHSFTTNEGINPQTGLLQRQYDGDLYGTTPYDTGTAYRITTNGVLTALLMFGGANGSNPSSLIEASDGNFYGTTQSGASNSGWGTVFQLTFNGRFTQLYSFTGGDDGAFPAAAVVQGTDGDFYGTASEGGPNNAGTVFKLSGDGSFSTIYAFTGGVDGYLPLAPLVQGRDGAFYGTTAYGGQYDTQAQGYGTVFKIAADGTMTSLASFAGSDGAYPQAGLLQGADGYFYGATTQGGASFGDTNSEKGMGYGTVFRISPSGVLTVVVSFTGTNGAYPQTSLVQTSDGTLYGTTAWGGAYNCGTVFKINPADLAPTLNLACASSSVALTWDSVSGQAYQLQYKSSLSESAWTNLGATLTASNYVLSFTDRLSPGTAQRFYRLLISR